MFSFLILMHICGAIIGILGGVLSMIFRKGSGLHRLSGNVFVIAMVVMTSTAAYLAIFHQPVRINVIAALLTFYLVGTGWLAGRRREMRTGTIDRVGLALALIAGILGLISGFQAAASPKGMLDKFPAAGYFFFGIVALLHAGKDVRMLLRGGVAGTQRIGRHLWRLSFALWIALGSLYPGQARLFPQAWRESGLLTLPVYAVIGATIFHLIRNRLRRRVSPPAAGERRSVDETPHGLRDGDLLAGDLRSAGALADG